MSAHSRLAPSSAFRWVPCPLSVALGEAYPALTQDPSGPEGAAAHEVWLMMLNGIEPAIGDMTSEGLPVTDEMIEGAQQFVDKVRSIAEPHNAMDRVRLEETVEMRGIHHVMFGTSDASIDLLELCGEWHMIDYKFGHRSVSPFENLQLAGYTFGEFERLGLTDEQIDNAKVFFHIVQPRCFYNRPANSTWETTGKNLRHLWDKMRESALDAITHELGARPKVGAWCRDCPGRRACPTLRTNAGANIDWINRSWPAEMPLEAAGLELKFVQAALAQLEAHASGLREQVEHGVTTGGHCPDWAMSPQPGRGKHWTVPAEDVFALGDCLDPPVDLRKKPEAVTPNQAIDLLKKAIKGFDASLIEEYAKPNPGSVKLIARTDTLAHRVFGAK